MFQEFFTDTLMSRFIKRLLRATNLPLYHIVEDDSDLVVGCKYIYKDFIIQCEKSGRLKIFDKDILYPSDNIYPLNKLFPGYKYQLAEFKVLDYYRPDDKKIHYNFHSKFMYYDSETHYYLGEYLRYLKDRTKLDLMAYYNCFNYQMIENITLDNTAISKYTMKKPKNKKLIAIPVKFGRYYTIAIDSDTPVEMRTLVYDKNIGNIAKDAFSDSYYSDDIDDYEFFSKTIFTKPILKYIAPDDEQQYSQEKNLYLAIQVAADNDSSIVVLEGNYINTWDNIQINYGDCDEDLLNQRRIKKPALLHFNCKTSFAFSDRLIEYLLLNVINPTEEISQNIEYVNKLISGNLDTDYAKNVKDGKVFTGLWNDQIRESIEEYIKELENNPDYSKRYLLRDQDGFLNSDIEKLFLTKGVL